MASYGPPSEMGPIIVLNAKTQCQTGPQAQLSNISAARSVADIICTTLGPWSMLKMLLDLMRSIVITKDGHCILREVDVSRPTAKSMMELSRAYNVEVDDGTTLVIILVGEVLIQAIPFLENSHSILHPTVIVQAYYQTLQKALELCEYQAVIVDVHDTKRIQTLVQSAIKTKFSSPWNDKIVDMTLQAVLMVARKHDNNSIFSTEVDLKRYAKVEKSRVVRFWIAQC